MKNKVLRICEITQHLKKMFSTKKVGCDRGLLLHNLVFLFQEKSESIEYLWHYTANFLHSFSSCILESKGLINKN